MDCREAIDQMAAFALDALDPSDESKLRAHVTDCQRCRDELAGYRYTVASLASAATDASPSPRLRNRVVGLALSEADPRYSPVPPIGHRRSSFWRSAFAGWTSIAVASAVVAVLSIGLAIALTFEVRRLRDEVGQEKALRTSLTQEIDLQYAALTSLAGSNTVARTLWGTENAPTARASILTTTNDRRAVLVAEGLPVLPPDRAYQLWLIKDGNRTSGGLMRPDNAGKAIIVIDAPQYLSSYQGFGVTDEPSGGSPQPTGTRILASSA